MFRLFLTLLLVAAVSPSATAQLAFELANPLVLVDGQRMTVEGAPLQQTVFGALLVEAPGWGTLRISIAPFAGARRAGDFDRTRLVIVLGGRSLRLRSSTPLLNADGPVPAYVRLETDAGMPASGPIRLGLVGTPDTATPFRPLDTRDDASDRQLDVEPPSGSLPSPIVEPAAETETDRQTVSQTTRNAPARLRAEIAILTAERNGLRAALADAQRDIADAQRERDDTRLRLGALLDEVERLQRALDAARQLDVPSRSPDRTSTSASEQVLRSERDQLRRDLDRLRDERARAQTETAPHEPASDERTVARLSLPGFDVARLDNPDEIQARLADTPYPEWAAESRLGGDVLVLFQTDARGAVVRTAVPRPVGGGLDAIAEEIVRAMRFHPVRADGQATRLRSQVVVRFTP